MQIEKTALPEVLIMTPHRFGDARGWFMETWNKRALEAAGVVLPEFVQDNHSASAQTGTLRGLHYQAPPRAQGKLVRCPRGVILDVAVDARRGSPRYGRWVGVELSASNARQLWIPPGFLHGFITCAPNTEVAYKCTDTYAPDCDGAVLWNSVGIDWGSEWGSDGPVLSDKDASAPPFSEFDSPFWYEG